MLNIKRTFKTINNEDGTATLEAIPLIVIFVIFFAYGLGLFGAIHSGILLSISSRTYAFETFRNRTNTNIFRYSANAHNGNLIYYDKIGFRFHLTYDHVFTGGNIIAVDKRIAMGLQREPQGDDETTHAINIYDDVITGERNKTVGVDPIWLAIGYGLCINAQCGAD